MVHFVICDDDKTFRDKFKLVIDKVMINDTMDYKVHSFNGYNRDLASIINSNEVKIYILDIELPKSKSGIDIARLIRNRDWESPIIMITSHTELGYDVLRAQIMLLGFISKFNNCEKQLYENLVKAVSKLGSRKVFIFENNNVSHKIFLDDVLYICKDTVDRKCIIKTAYNDFSVPMTLTDILQQIGDRFKYSHRSCLVNTDRIRTIDWKNNVIEFDDGSQTDFVSRDKKKELKEYAVVD